SRLTCIIILFPVADRPDVAPIWVVLAYPLVMAGLLAGYGYLVGDPPALLVSCIVAGLWMVKAVWWGYAALRQIVVGLDQIAISLALFVIAVLISLGKSGLLTRWLTAWGWVPANGAVHPPRPPENPSEPPRPPSG